MNLNKLRINYLPPTVKSSLYNYYQFIDNKTGLNKVSLNPIEKKNILTLKNTKKEKIAYIIGNGPSVRVSDLEKLRNRVTFCANRFYLAYDLMKFRPKYYLVSDPQMIEDFGDEIVQKSSSLPFIISLFRPALQGVYYWIPMLPEVLFDFSTEISRGVAPGGAVIVSGIQIANYMGINKIILYGIDHNFDYKLLKDSKTHYNRAIGDNNHFISNYRSGKSWCPPDIELIESGIKSCDEYLRSQGGWVKNATHGGHLEVCERVNFNEIL